MLFLLEKRTNLQIIICGKNSQHSWSHWDVDVNIQTLRINQFDHILLVDCVLVPPTICQYIFHSVILYIPMIYLDDLWVIPLKGKYRMGVYYIIQSDWDPQAGSFTLAMAAWQGVIWLWVSLWTMTISNCLSDGENY